MEIQYEEINKCPVVMIDNLFSEEQLEHCWGTIDSLDIRQLLPPNETSGAMTEDGRPLKNNRGIFLNEIYQFHPHQCRIGNAWREVYTEICKKVHSMHPAFRVMEAYDVTHDLSLLLSYYGNSDYYGRHRDSTTITSLIWLAKDETKFEGGNLLVEDQFKIEYKHNRLVLFPGYTYHQVGPVTMKEEDAKAGLGRYVFSCFHDHMFG